MPQHTIRATFDEQTIRVYQAYRPEIALPALNADRFVPPIQNGAYGLDQAVLQLDDVPLRRRGQSWSGK